MTSGRGIARFTRGKGAGVTAKVSGISATSGDTRPAASEKDSVTTTEHLLPSSSGTPSDISGGQAFDNVDMFGGSVDMHFEMPGDGGSIDLAGGRSSGDDFLASPGSSLSIAAATTDAVALADEDFEAIFDANMAAFDLGTVGLTKSLPSPSDKTSMLTSGTTAGISISKGLEKSIQSGRSGSNSKAVPSMSPGSGLSRFASRKIKGRVPRDSAAPTTPKISSTHATVTESTMVHQTATASLISLVTNPLKDAESAPVLVAQTPTGEARGTPPGSVNGISKNPYVTPDVRRVTSHSSARMTPAYDKADHAVMQVARPPDGEVTTTTGQDGSCKENLPPDIVDEHLNEEAFEEILSHFRDDLRGSSHSLESSNGMLIDREVDLSLTFSQALSYWGDFMDLADDTEGLEMIADDILENLSSM